MDLKSYEYMLGQINALTTENSGGLIWLDDLVEDPDIDFLLSPSGGW